MKILYIGTSKIHTTTMHRCNALRRLGHEVICFDPLKYFHSYKISTKLIYEFSSYSICLFVNSNLRKEIYNKKYDVVWIDGGAPLTPKSYKMLKQTDAKIINYNNDDPFNKETKYKWYSYKKCLKYHDITIVVRDQNINEVKKNGAKNVKRIYMSYDPVAHKKRKYRENDYQKWKSDIVFVGTWMPGRGKIMFELQKHFDLHIYGDRWNKSKYSKELANSWKSKSLKGADYVKAIQYAKIAIGLLSKGNRDEHTTRSLEIPYINGAILCAERTIEHTQMYKEDVEAIFWSSTEECIEKCKKLIENTNRLKEISDLSYKRVLSNKCSNDDVIMSIINLI